MEAANIWLYSESPQKGLVCEATIWRHPSPNHAFKGKLEHPSMESLSGSNIHFVKTPSEKRYHSSSLEKKCHLEKGTAFWLHPWFALVIRVLHWVWEQCWYFIVSSVWFWLLWEQPLWCSDGQHVWLTVGKGTVTLWHTFRKKHGKQNRIRDPLKIKGHCLTSKSG